MFQNSRNAKVLFLLAKGNFRFAPLMYLEAALSNIEKMPQSTFDEIVEKYVEMNIAHPFREGNGRSTRVWLDLLLKVELQQVVDWSRVDKEGYLLAVESSPIRDTESMHVLKNALSDEIENREVHIKSIDHGYIMKVMLPSRPKNCNDSDFKPVKIPL